MKIRAFAATCLLVLATLSGCMGPPPKLVTFYAGNVNGGATAMIVTVDIVFTEPVEKDAIHYPYEWVVNPAPFYHFHSAGVGSVIHLSITVVPTKPGQKVECSVSVDGVLVDTKTGGYPAGTICLGPAI